METKKTQTLGFYGNPISMKQMAHLMGEHPFVDCCEKSTYTEEQRAADWLEFAKDLAESSKRMKKNGGFWHPMGNGGGWESFKTGKVYSCPADMDAAEGPVNDN